ncbi:IS3 family transposase [Alkalibacillus salilacus]|nr:IS3 family transposase [Alkalibacillus salilacus]
MSKTIFTAKEMERLEQNPYVDKVSDRSITYNSEFKIQAVEENLKGKGPQQIFIEHGFDLTIIGESKPQQCLKRWRKTYDTYGKEGFRTERRGKGATGRPSKQDLTPEEELKQAEARIKYLEAENDFPKKARRTRKAGDEEAPLKPCETYEIIERTIRMYQLNGLTTHLCQLAGVSKSGYYKWLKNEPARQEAERQDEQAFQLIEDIFLSLNGKAGAQTIRMILENDEGIVMNLKKIRRIMKKYGLITKMRQANPYKKMAQATQEHKTCDNLVNRAFDQDEPGKVLLTDITYLYDGHGNVSYLSAIKDAATHEILAHHVSSSLRMDIVYQTLTHLVENGFEMPPESFFHSDQGFHYTHPIFQQQLKDMGFTQSMSRKGNCWDNAPMESFFGHLKDDIDIKACHTMEEVKTMIHDYIAYYNSSRYQWTLKKMTPNQYRGHLLAA